MLSIIYPLTQLSGVARCGAICWSCSTLQYCSDVHPTACSYFPVHKSSLVKEFTQARLAIEWEVIFVSSYSRCLMFQYINLHDVIACGYICTEKVVMAHRSEELETTIISYAEACMPQRTPRFTSCFPISSNWSACLGYFNHNFN